MQRSTHPSSRTLWLLLAGFMLTIVLLDQWLKVWVKTHMVLGQEFSLIGSWARIHFTENNGIAFGLSPSSVWAKALLSLFRIVAMGTMVGILIHLVRRQKAPLGLLLGLAGLIAGALGNIIDGTFYGLIFSSSEGLVLQGEEFVQPLATLFPSDGGYAPLFHGKVVDMLYFPILEFTWPQWVPIWGGKYFQFFQPVFNIADASITASVFYLLLFQWKNLFGKHAAKGKA